MRRSAAVLLFSVALASAGADPLAVVPYKVAPEIPDALHAIEPDQVRIEGWLGARIDANMRGRLEVVDTVPLLAGFIAKPGDQPWIGEHIGKWLHAATLAWAYTRDDALRRKLDQAAAQLIATQEPDGYLGTYVPSQRFGLYPGADWDVWSHAYDMIGLLTYYRYTGNEAALVASRRVADLLIGTFPAKKSILAAGTHVGMAATSVLEPIVELYRLTGDRRYLDFARYIVSSYDEPGGPRIVRSMLADHDVSRTADGKAYEMMANLMGICDLARVTGDRKLLLAVLNAWGDIVGNRLYLTGTSSTQEAFAGDHVLPNDRDSKIGETCVTTTWIQLNLQLLQVTGDPAYADQIERSLYNHLAAAQNPRGDDWCYYTPLEGRKQYDKDITCCHSSGPRGLALAPTAAYLQSADAIYVSTFETSQAHFMVGGQPVEIDQQSGFPRAGRAVLTIHTPGPATFDLRIRVPEWAAPLRSGDEQYEAGWTTLRSGTWKDGDHIAYTFTLTGSTIAGTYTNLHHTAAAWGPFILAADTARNPGLTSLGTLRLADGAEPSLASSAGSLSFAIAASGQPSLVLVPFADAGATGGEYRVWLRDAP